MLDLTGCIHLRFGLPNATDNLPRVVSSSLLSLSFDRLTQLRTGPMGPADNRWLEGMPALTKLYLQGLPSAVISTSALFYASRTLQWFACDVVIGDIGPLLSLPSLAIISLSGASLHWQLPTNVSDVWPHLAEFSLSGSNLDGPLPDFHDLPALSYVSRTVHELRRTQWRSSTCAHGV